MISLFLYRFPFTLLFLFRCCFRFRFRFPFPFPFLFRIPVSGFSRRPFFTPCSVEKWPRNLTPLIYQTVTVNVGNVAIHVHQRGGVARKQCSSSVVCREEIYPALSCPKMRRVSDEEFRSCKRTLCSVSRAKV